MEFIEGVYNWTLMQSFWLQVLVVMLAIVIGLIILGLALTIICSILYIPTFLLGRYLGIFAIFLIVPTFMVMITNNGQNSIMSVGWQPLLIATLATFYGYWQGLKERKKAKMKKRIMKMEQKTVKSTSKKDPDLRNQQTNV
ncbi:hypothetical protein ACIQ4Z_07835 [Peribacillus asahii]|uniref:hypothetical protein n=1 Tax=Peribacillus asahii TaxID=228899 RepID=UPI003805D437